MNWKNCYNLLSIFLGLILIIFNISSLEINNCAICLDSLTEIIQNGEAITLPCGHQFHEHCIDQQISQPEIIDVASSVNPNNTIKTLSSNQFCGLCRFYIGTKNQFQLYKLFLQAEQSNDFDKALGIINKLSKQMFQDSVLNHSKNNFRMMLDFFTHLDQQEMNAKIEKCLSDIQKSQQYIGEKLNMLIKKNYYFKSKIYKRFKLLKKVYDALENTVFIKQQNTRSLFGRLLSNTVNRIENNQILSDGIEFFKEDKVFCKIITKHYLRIYT